MKGRIIAFAVVLMSTGVFAQSKYGATPEDSLNCLKNLSLFNEFYDQSNYNDAYGPWQNAVALCPSASKNLYIKGAKMLPAMIKAETDDARKKALVDTLLFVYDKRIEHFGQRGYVLGRKAGEIARYVPNSTQEVFEVARESIELRGDKSEASALILYYQSLYNLVKAEKQQVDMLLSEFPRLMSVVEANLDGKYGKYYQQAADGMSSIFGTVASCESLVEIYQSKFDAAPQDTNVQKQILKFFEMRDCTDEELYTQAAIAYDKINPSPESKLAIGIGLLKKQRYSEAGGFLEQAAEGIKDSEKKATAYKYAAMASLARNSYAQAKSFALKWLSVDPNAGEAYMLIGDAYMGGAKSIGDNACTKRFAYIAAVDKYNRARSLDSSLSDKLNRKVAQAKSNYPFNEDCFFHSINEGSQQKVGGWINETITVVTQQK